MVTRIKEYKEDPNKKKRGPGPYYLRGPLTSKLKNLGYTGPAYFSKYSPSRDAKVKSRGYEIDKIGIPKGTRYPHTSDGEIKRWEYWGIPKKKR